MEAIYLFVLILIGFTIGFAIILGQSSTVDIMAHWAERRCDFDVVMSSFMYKPDSYTGSSFDFASENFNFCVGAMSSDYLQTLFGSLFEVLRKQMGAADIMTNVMKTLRSQLNTVYAPFKTMMDKFWNKFKQIGGLSSRVFQHLYMSMKKAAATGIASVFVALSLQTALLNSIDLVIKIIMVVLYILIGFAVIFFLPILPLLVIVMMAVAGIESAMPGKTGGVGAVFCFHEATPIVMRDGSIKPIKDIKLGDLLWNASVVEARVELPGSEEPLYDIYGVHVSGDHRIWSESEQKWILVRAHTDSVETTKRTNVLYTLITSDRVIPIKSVKGYLRFADWEELAPTPAAELVWEQIVRDILNPNSESVTSDMPKHAPCFDYFLMVKKFQSGWTPISEIQRGDWIMGHNGWTKVLGICRRTVMGGIGPCAYRVTDGIWVLNSNQYEHLGGICDTTPWSGINLITDSGCFQIQMPSGQIQIVRDFTEVGWMNLRETYARVENAMMDGSNKKDECKGER